MNNLQNKKFATITVTLGAKDTSVNVSYPDDFDGQNCIIINTELELSIGVFIPYYFSSVLYFDCVKFTDYISVASRYTEAVNKKVRLTLMKI